MPELWKGDRMPASFFMRRPVRRKFAAKAAHGPRGEQGKSLPCWIAQARAAPSWGMGQQMGREKTST